MNSAHPKYQKQLSKVTGVILAGGQSSRMGSNKALLPYRGRLLVEGIHRLLSEIFSEVILVTNNPEDYEFLPCRKVPDMYLGMGVLAGIHSGLCHSGNPAIFVVASDMPYLNARLIRHLSTHADDGGVLIPESPGGLEPLHAVYGRGCLGAIEEALETGQRRIVSFFDRVTVNRMSARQVACFDPVFDCFVNINTPNDYYALRPEPAMQWPAGEEECEKSLR